MTEVRTAQSPITFTKPWLLIVIVCSALPFVLLTALFNDPGRGRAAGICTVVILYAARARWNLRFHWWFWAMLVIFVILQAFIVALIPWTSKSYPGFTLFPIALVDYAFVYGGLMLSEKLMLVDPRSHPPYR